MNYVYTRDGETFINVGDTNMLGEDIEYTKDDLLCMLHDIEQYDKNEGILSQKDALSLMNDVIYQNPDI